MYNGDGIFLRGRAGVGKGQRAFHFCASDNNLAVFFSKLRSRSGESALSLCEWIFFCDVCRMFLAGWVCYH